jgi:hypothetical protein
MATAGRVLPLALAAIACSAPLAPGPGARAAVAQTLQAEEYAVKAAFLFNFARFTEWPAAAFASDDAPLVLCIVGTDPFGPALDAIEKKPVKGHPLRVDRKATEDGLSRCHVAFISRSRAGDLAEVLKPIETARVLTVSDIPDFARKGGMIGLLMEERKVRFEINVSAADRAGLKLSSQLLKLASIVKK